MKLNCVRLLMLISFYQVFQTIKHRSKSRVLSRSQAQKFVRDLRYAKPPKRIGNFEIGKFKLKHRGLRMKGITERDLIRMEEKNLKFRKKNKMGFPRIPRYLKSNKKNKFGKHKKRKLHKLSAEDKERLEELKAKRHEINAEIAETLHENQHKFINDHVASPLGLDEKKEKINALLGAGALTTGAVMGHKRRKKLKYNTEKLYSQIMASEMMIGTMNKEINALKDVVDRLTAAGTKASRIEYDLTFLIQRKISNTIF